jgi:hypothetical protein
MCAAILSPALAGGRYPARLDRFQSWQNDVRGPGFGTIQIPLSAKGRDKQPHLNVFELDCSWPRFTGPAENQLPRQGGFGLDLRNELVHGHSFILRRIARSRDNTSAGP